MTNYSCEKFFSMQVRREGG